MNCRNDLELYSLELSALNTTYILNLLNVYGFGSLSRTILIYKTFENIVHHIVYDFNSIVVISLKVKYYLKWL